jgi:hypothetical protein
MERAAVEPDQRGQILGREAPFADNGIQLGGIEQR